MPVKRRPGKMHTSSELTAVEMAFLKSDSEPEEAAFGEWMSLTRDDDAFRPGRPPVRDMWRELGADIVQEHAQAAPGTRPSLWWKHDAPEGRRRLDDGPGKPGWPDRLSRGIPTGWQWPRTLPVGATFVGGPEPCDPDHPPLYEAEAHYLRRLDLLLPGELERLEPEDFEPEAIER